MIKLLLSVYGMKYIDWSKIISCLLFYWYFCFSFGCLHP